MKRHLFKIDMKKWMKHVTEREILKFKKSWTWPDKVQDLLSLLLEAPSLHIFSGSSNLGDVRVDISEKCDLRADCLHLPFRDEVFQTTFGDPPWHMAKHLRAKCMYELRRVTRVHGLLIINANWNPNRMKGTVLIEPIYVSPSKMPFGNTALIMRYYKTHHEAEVQEMVSKQRLLERQKGLSEPVNNLNEIQSEHPSTETNRAEVDNDNPQYQGDRDGHDRKGHQRAARKDHAGSSENDKRADTRRWISSESHDNRTGAERSTRQETPASRNSRASKRARARQPGESPDEKGWTEV